MLPCLQGQGGDRGIVRSLCTLLSMPRQIAYTLIGWYTRGIVKTCGLVGFKRRDR
jgi:hypothetical protein